MRIGPSLSAGLASVREVAALIRGEIDGFIRRRLGGALVLIVAASVLTALAPVAFKLIVDGFTGQASGASVNAVHLILLYVLSQWLARVLGEFRTLVYTQAERRMYRTLSQRLFAHVMHLPLRFHLDRQTGAVSQTLTNGLMGYQMILQQSVFTLLPVAVELATVAVVLVRLEHGTFLGIFLLALLGYAVAFAIGVARLREPARHASSAYIDANAVLTDSILNYETVKYFNAEALVRDRYDSALSRTESEWLRLFRRKTYNGLCVATIFALSLALTIGYAAYEVQRGTMTVGDFVMVNAYLLQVVRPIEMLGFAMQQLSQAFAFLEKMIELFRQPTEARESGGAAAAHSGQLEFDDVSLSYRADRTVLRNVSFTVGPGRTLGIVGASGAGKSSLVRLLVRLFEPDGGRILLDGVAIAELSLPSLRQAIAVVPQDTVLFNDTIGYNIAFGRPGSTREEIEQAARLAHLHEFVEHLPDGYDTLVGERGVKLSGGEKQRVSIARAALKQPRIFVFDEATSSLDSRTEHEILGNLHEISRAGTTLVIAHRLSTVVHADEIIVLDHGSIVERGTHASLLHRGGRYAALWQAQQESGSPRQETGSLTSSCGSAAE